MNNNEFSNLNFWNDGCSSRGACSINPSVASLQELLLYMIKQLSYYILELDKLCLNNDNLIKNVIKSISSLILINEINEKNLYSLILQNYYALDNAKSAYKKVASERNMEVNLLDYSINFNQNTSISSAISEGSRLLKNDYNFKTSVIRNYIQVLIAIIKSVCLNISKLYNYDICEKLLTHIIFQAINYLNTEKPDLHRLKEFSRDLAMKDLSLNLQIAKELQANFGKVSEVVLSHSSRNGKAILVSGTNFFDLHNVLKLAKENNIDVYTHSELLIAHSLERFKQYDNLVGHYGDSTENCIVDFGTFPGAILLTGNSQNNTEFLYRGKIFSNDYNIPQGVIKIENSDYSPLIASALESRGFIKGQIRPDTMLGFNEEEAKIIMDNVMKKLACSEITRLYILIENSFTERQNEYFKTFLNNINDDEFVLSFSHGISDNNKMVINLGNYYPLIIEFLNSVLKNRIQNERIIFMLNTCSPGIISSIVMLKELGAENIYLSPCSPRQINPSVFETFINQYALKYTTSPLQDLTSIRQNIS